MFTRALLASIRTLGGCPCPRCLIPLSRAHHTGLPEDAEERTSLARIDDKKQRRTVTKAHKLIYKENYSVTSAETERLLKPNSLVPIAVSELTTTQYCFSLRSFLECIYRAFVPTEF